MGWFRDEGIEPSRHHACLNMTSRIQLAVQGMGIAIIPAMGASRELTAGDLRMVETVRPLPALDYLLVHGDLDLTPAGAAVANLARELLSEQMRFCMPPAQLK